ncbi:serine/arginine repetitive matrix protein 1-like isoform X6 [Syngnathoides biaculeatus]|uniref:serine/arginine repetitive matrix protein 1-like isoform X6 n=1 Tax=Syngnathoides biaculeatus TaxID=300417 RepID=UPI002ADD7C31|nr:serine/arginine repetitive matrix protein 1-like isoform X6 [Syngnathoides biaculeatus]
MKRKRVARIIDLDEMELGQSVWSLFFIPKWWILVAFLAGLLPQQCCGVHVLVKDEKKYAVLFQSVVLPCQFNSVSTQTPIVQWVYKSYCRDRTRDSFRLSDSLSGGSGGAGPMGGSGHDVGKKASYLDCSDSGRTVRTVASVSGSSLTLSEYYKNRDVSIINKADLRIAEVQWGDSGVYTCKVVIADDVVGQNEASVELLVLGFSGAPGDLLPDFELKIMPACGVSELSSLHEGETAFRPTFRKVQKKALPPIPDVDLQPEPRRYRDNCSPEPQRFRDDAPSSPQRYRQDPESEPRHCAEDSLPPRRYSDDPPPSSQSRRHIRDARQQNHSEENRHNRWNPRSEHLERKTYHTGGRTGSLDELEEFAATYKQRGRRRGENRDDEDDEPEHQEFSRYPSYRHGPPRHRYDDRNELRDGSDREDRPRRKKKHGHNISPLPSPKKGRGTWGNERSASPPPNVSPPSTSSQEKDYDGAFLNSLLERKAKLREVVQGKPGTRGEDDSDTPSKGSSKKSSGESGRHCSRSPSDRPEAHSPALYSDPERSRNGRPSPRPLPTRTRSPQPPAPASPLNRRGETRDKARKVQGTLLSRDSLIV